MEIVSSAPSGRAFGVELKVHATPLVWIERTCHWQAAFHRDTLQSAVSKTRNVVEGILTLVFGLALVALVLAGVLEEILQPARRSYGLVEVLIGLFIMGAAGFIGVAFTLDGWRQTLGVAPSAAAYTGSLAEDVRPEGPSGVNGSLAGPYWDGSTSADLPWWNWSGS